MRRVDSIKARIINVASRETGVGKGMRIPGMKIGTQMSPRGPSLEDVTWLAETLERAGMFIKTANYQDKEDSLIAQRIVGEIDEVMQ